VKINQTISDTSFSPGIGALALTDKQQDCSTYIEVMNALSHGQFSAGKGKSGQFGKALGELVLKLEANAHGAIASTASMAGSTVNTMTKVAEMAGDLRILNAGTQSIASAIKDLSVSSDNLSQNASSAAKDANEVRASASARINEVKQAIAAIKHVNDVVGAMAGRQLVLEQAALQITDMVDSIEKISSHTKLLALNASVEAARAGDSGRGFGVVALEVKSLSEQTSATTDQMRSRINTLNSEMTAISKIMEESLQSVSSGQQIVTDVGQRIVEMSEQTTTIANHMSEISEVIDHQRMSAAKISGKITEIAGSSEAVHQNAEGVIKIGSKTTELIDRQFHVFEEMELSTYVLQRAKVDHLLWKRNIAEMFAGLRQINPGDLASHHSCRLGKWYHHINDPQLTGNRAFLEIARPHERVHSLGRAAVEAFNAGDRAKALHSYQMMEKASAQVLHLLEELIKATHNREGQSRSSGV